MISGINGINVKNVKNVKVVFNANFVNVNATAATSALVCWISSLIGISVPMVDALTVLLTKI